jgi:hypothetical protein
MPDRPTLSRSERDAILRESGYRCGVPTCNTTIALDIHHIIHISEGGGNDPFNLFAVCPTCHALYHRGVISLESIKEWKARLIAINNAADVRAEVDARVERLRAEEEHVIEGRGQRTGLSLAASEFQWRTCELGFRYDEKMFVTTGFCCFAPNVAVTSGEAVSIALDVAAVRDGVPSIRTLLGLAPFEVLRREKTGNLVAVKMGTIDDSHVKRLLARHNDEQLSRMFSPPLQTQCKFRLVPFVGKRLAFLHTCSNSEEYRVKAEFQFDSADVSFAGAFRKNEDDFLQWVLSPVMSRIEHRGAPLFNANAELVGVMGDTVLFDGETAWRPIASAIFPFHDLLVGQAHCD